MFLPIALTLLLVAFSGAEQDILPYNVANYHFMLHTRSSQSPHVLNLKNGSSLMSSSYDPKKPTNFVSYSFVPKEGDLVQALLHANDVNVIVLHPVSMGPLSDQQKYPQQDRMLIRRQEQPQYDRMLLRQQGQQHVGPTRIRTVAIGKKKIPFAALSIYRLLSKLIGYGAQPQQFHFIVHGEDAHMAGIAAKLLLPHRIARITALNPKYYDHNAHAYQKFTIGDAEFIDVIWTCLNSEETYRENAHAVFLANGGKHPQPGVDPKDENESCMRSLLYYQESILRPTAFKAITPGGIISSRMGEYAPRKNGVFSVVTKTSSPFGYDDDEDWPRTL